MRKEILHIVVFMLFTLPLYSQIVAIEAQSDDTNPNTYFKDVNNVLNKFTGIWQYTDATQSVRIQIYKLEYVEGMYGLSNTSHEDELRSFIEYKVLQGGTWVTKYNTFPNPVEFDESQNKQSIRGNLISQGNLNKVSLNYDEPSNSCGRIKSAMLGLTYSVTGDVQKLQWQRKDLNDKNALADIPCPNGLPGDNSDFIMPRSMMLTKVK